ncbi:uncharacterized protein LOC127721775 [Mytilus californianus]|uniref:uncharacterized protein LOC127721775 n=1 Tax=Mytilus californianus TaxID=6549 RepID=UPI002246D9C3|nr:uncharacterized protein LOC127721775 [Mytilus californianus]XP_052084526.1 uncharacterized protein LOC127721775 [Mytilus californianus]
MAGRQCLDGTLGYTVTEEDGVKYNIHCSICGRGFMGKAGLATHMKSHINVAVKTCLESKPVEPLEPVIVKSDLTKECLSNYQCLICGQGFDKLCGLLSHERGHQKKLDNVGKKFECKVCKQEFNCLKFLTRHAKTHNGNYRNREKRYSCEVCGASFYGNSQLRVHRRTHNGSRPFSCNYCEKKFLDSGNCRTHVNKVHFGKLKDSRYYCDVCHKGFHYKCVLKKHILIHTKEKIYKCEYCSKTFSWKLCYDLHLKLHSGEAMHQCTICQKTYPTNHILEKHMNTHTKEKEYKCDICNKIFYKRGNMSKHRMIHFDNKPYKCSTCGKGFKQNSTMRTHEDIHNPEHLRKRKSRKGVKDFHCEVCKRSFSSKETLRNHSRLHTGDLFACEICNRQFTYLKQYVIHKRKHTGEITDKCHICGKGFICIGYLRKHLKMLAGTRKWKCEVCDKQFTQSGALKKHMRTHTGELPWACTICERRFACNDSLLQHEKQHKGIVDKFFHCHLCPKTFSRSSGRLIHMRTVHERLRPFKCDTCTKTFSTKSNLQKHLMVHNDERPHECQQCNRAFRTQSKLKYHVNVVHVNKKPSKCLICQRVFKNQGNLKIHNKMKHKDALGNQNLSLSEENMNSINTLKDNTLKCYKCKKIFKTKFSYNRHMKVAHGLSLAPTLCLQKLDGKIKSSTQTVKGHVQKDSGILEKLKCSFSVGNNLPLKDKNPEIDMKQNCHTNIFDSFLNNKKTLEIHKAESSEEVGITSIVKDRSQSKCDGNIFEKMSRKKEATDIMSIGEKEGKPLSTDLHTNIFEKIMMKPNSNSGLEKTSTCLPEKKTNDAKSCSRQSRENAKSKLGNQLKMLNLTSLRMKKNEVGNIFSNLNGIKPGGNDLKSLPEIKADLNLTGSKTLDIECMEQANGCRNLFDDLLNDKRKSDDFAIFQNTTDDLVSNQKENEIILIADDAKVRFVPELNENLNARLDMTEKIEDNDINEIDYTKKRGRNLFDELISNCNVDNKISQKKNEMSGFEDTGQNSSLMELQHASENMEIKNQGHVIIVDSNYQQIRILLKEGQEDIINKAAIRIGSDLGQSDTLQISKSDVGSDSGKTAIFMTLDNCEHMDVSNLDNVNENDEQTSKILTAVEIDEQNKIRELEDNSMHEQITEQETSKENQMEILQDIEPCTNTDDNNLKNLEGQSESTECGQGKKDKQCDWNKDLTIFEKIEQMIKSKEICYLTEKTAEDDHEVKKKEAYKFCEINQISVDLDIPSTDHDIPSTDHENRMEENSLQNVEVEENFKCVEENNCIEDIDCNVQSCDNEEKMCYTNVQKVNSLKRKADEETVKNDKERETIGHDPTKEISAFNLFEKFSHFSYDTCMESDDTGVEQDNPIDCGHNENINFEDTEETRNQEKEKENFQQECESQFLEKVNKEIISTDEDRIVHVDVNDSYESDKINGQEIEKINGQEIETINGQEIEKINGQDSEKTNGQESEKTKGQESEKINGKESEKTNDQENEKINGQEIEKIDSKEIKKNGGQESEKIDSQKSEKIGGQESENLKGDQSTEHDECKDEHNNATFSLSERIPCHKETKLASHNDEMHVEHNLPQIQALQMNKEKIVYTDTGNTKNISEMPRCNENDKQTEEKSCSCEDSSTNCDEMFIKKQLFSDKEKDEVVTGSIGEKKEENKNIKTNEKHIQKDSVVKKRKYKGVKVFKQDQTIVDQSSVRKGNIKIIGKKLYLIGRKRTMSENGESENKSTSMEDNPGKVPNKDGPITNKTEFTAYENENFEKDSFCHPDKEVQHLQRLTICDENTYTESAEFLIEQCTKPKLVFKDGLFWCDLCDKSFKTKSSLRTHKFSHREKYNFTCQACGMGFSWEDHLERHMNVHLKTSTYIDLLQSYNAS